MLSKSNFHLFLIMKINNYKKNLLVNFYISNNIYKNTVFKNSEILFLKIATELNSISIFTHNKLIFILYNEIFK